MLRGAEEAGDKARAERLNAVTCTLARGVAEYKRRTKEDFYFATLEQARAEIQGHERRNEGPRKESSASEHAAS